MLRIRFVFKEFLLFASLAVLLVLVMGSAPVPQASAVVTETDLDAFLVERTPKMNYDASPNMPQPGQAVTFYGHVRHWGDATSPVLASVQYQWKIDGQVVSTGTITNFEPLRNTTFDYRGYPNQNDDATLRDPNNWPKNPAAFPNPAPTGWRVVQLPWTWQNGAHTVEFVVDQNNLIAEKSELNNARNDQTNALSFSAWVEEGTWAYFHQYQHQLGIGSNSWEDWIQRQMAKWNELSANAIWPDSPNGVLDRVRIDRIIVVPNGVLPVGTTGAATNSPDSTDNTIDLQWGFVNDNGPYSNHTSLSLDNRFYTEKSLTHELGHARYLIDGYGFDVHNTPAHHAVQIYEGSTYVAGSAYMPFLAHGQVLHYNTSGGVMGDSGPYGYTWSPYEAAALNRIAGQRAKCGNMNAPCNIGDYLHNLPQCNHLRILDSNGQPRRNVDVRIYEAEAGIPQGWYGKTFDNTPDQFYTTDDAGYVRLPQNPFNPGGLVEHWVGIATGVLIVRIQEGAQVWYRFLEVADFNMEYFRGHTSDGYYNLRLPGSTTPPPGPTPPPPTCPATATLFDDFTQGGTAADPTVWGAATGNGGTVTKDNGIVTANVPNTANSFAELYSLASFPVGATMEALVRFNEPHSSDRKGVGFADFRIGTSCFGGETNAAMWRGHTNQAYVETKVPNAATCTQVSSYSGGWRIIKVERVSSTQVRIYQNGILLGTISTNVSQAALPIRLGALNDSPPTGPISIQIDWVKVTAPDLIVQSLATVPAQPSAGSPVSFSGVVKNQGALAGGASTTRLRIDVDNNGTWDVVPATMPTSSLASLAAETETWSNAWTGTVGTHRFEVCADIGAVVGEGNENNNCTTQTFTITPGDLTITNIYGDSRAWPGESITRRAVVKNIGNSTTPAAVLRAHLSIDATLDGSDVFIGDFAVPALVAGAEAVVEFTTTVPGGWDPYLPSRLRRVLATVDPANSVTEASESNNVANRTLGMSLNIFDVNGDGPVGTVDIAMVLSAVGATPASTTWNPDADVDGTGTVTTTDRDIVTAHFGEVSTHVEGHLSGSPATGPAPLLVNFTYDCHYFEGTVTLVEFDFNGDGTWDQNISGSGTRVQGSVNYTFAAQGTYSPKVRCTDSNAYLDIGNASSVVVSNELLNEDFSGASLNTSLWGTATSATATIMQSGGLATITIPAAANAYADLYSLAGFAVGTTFEARVNVSAGQFFDHKGIGYANARVSSDCGVGETQAAMWRGQDGSKVIETKNGAASCTGVQSNYPAGWRTIKVVRVSTTQANFYEEGVLLGSLTTNVPGGSLPIRFSGWTYTSGPGQAITIQVDWVKVTVN